MHTASGKRNSNNLVHYEWIYESNKEIVEIERRCENEQRYVLEELIIIRLYAQSGTNVRSNTFSQQLQWNVVGVAATW